MSAHYDSERDRIVIVLASGMELGLTPDHVEGLAGAAREALEDIVIESQGLGIHFPQLDADLYVPGLMEGDLGSRKWMARLLGAAGGQSRTEAKAAAARENGLQGGRPRKAPAPGR